MPRGSRLKVQNCCLVGFFISFVAIAHHTLSIMACALAGMARQRSEGVSSCSSCSNSCLNSSWKRSVLQSGRVPPSSFTSSCKGREGRWRQQGC